ncbi:MAG: ATP-binding cassette domain-containing protein [Gammaproteobacteria bacterium]|nr:ATP-binding cassette domain-containing protein [Gammaproteobacteria bacterium]
MDGRTIEAHEVSKRVTGPEGTLELLAGIDLAVGSGESLAVVGPSGAGKSTLLGLLAGLDLPSGGRVWLDGHELTALDEDGRAAVRAGRVGFVFQSFQLLDNLTARENVMLPLELAGSASAGARADEVLERVGLSRRAAHYPYQLSGGEQQRVALARAFAPGPRILFADEPTGNLDQRTGAAVGDLLFELNREFGTTLVLVTHDRDLAGRCARTLELDEGRVVAG